VSDQELVELYLQGDPAARDAVEGNPALLREAAEHARMEAALRILYESEDTSRQRALAIMADVRGESAAQSFRHLRRSIRPPFRRLWLPALAASLVALLGFGSWVLRPARSVPVQTGDVLVLQRGERGHYTTANGYDFTLDGPADLIVGRTLRLRAGRLSVHAGKRPDGDPLVVLAPHARTEVLGTRFVIEATGNATLLAVNEGQVRFVPNGAPPLIVDKGRTAAANVAARDPIRQPFASDSPWNTAIGSLARFEPLPTLRLNRGVHVESREWAVPVFVASPTDPVRTLYYRSSGKHAGQIRIDPAVPVLDGSVGTYLALVDERLDNVWELGGAVRDSNGDYRAGDIDHTDLRGPGWGMSGPGHSGASLLGGLIRRGELRDGVPHALAVLVRAGTVNRSGQPFEWPATHALSKWNIYGTNGNVRLGSLLALPADVDISTIDGPARMLAEALQNYGAYVVGTFISGQNEIVMLAECAADPDLPKDMDAKLAPFILRLQRVANNSPGTPGGGGAPRRQPPPPLVVLAP